MKIRNYTFIEFLIWFFILCLIIFGIRFYRYQKVKSLKSYQIFLSDIDGLIVGSPVKYMGVKIGYIKDIKYMQDNMYVKFVITDKNCKLPPGVIATVEFYGLGGSKSLEIYPPDKNENNKRIIVVQNPTRISDATGLLGQMLSKINSISARCTHFADELGVKELEEEDISIDSGNFSKGLKETDSFLDIMESSRETLMNKMKRFKKDEQRKYTDN